MAKKRTKPVAAAIDDSLGDAPVYLSGPSSSLRGTLYLKNTGNSPIQVFNARITYKVQSDGGEKEESIVIPLSAYLEPGIVNRIKLKVNLSPFMAPQILEGVLEFEGYSRPVVVQIIEVVELVLSPDTLVIDTAPGSKITRQVAVINQGNTILKIGTLGELPLAQEVMPQWRAQVTAGSIDGGLEALFADVPGEEIEPLLKPAGVLKVRNKGGAFELNPGEMRVVEVEIGVPRELELNARYLAQLPLYTSDLRFVVVPVEKRG